MYSVVKNLYAASSPTMLSIRHVSAEPMAISACLLLGNQIDSCYLPHYYLHRPVHSRPFSMCYHPKYDRLRHSSISKSRIGESRRVIASESGLIGKSRWASKSSESGRISKSRRTITGRSIRRGCTRRMKRCGIATPGWTGRCGGGRRVTRWVESGRTRAWLRMPCRSLCRVIYCRYTWLSHTARSASLRGHYGASDIAEICRSCNASSEGCHGIYIAVPCSHCLGFVIETLKTVPRSATGEIAYETPAHLLAVMRL